MNPHDNPTRSELVQPPSPTTEIPISQLVAQVYESAPPALRSRLLEHLLMPLGVLSLVAVANGIFAKIRFRSGGPDMHIRFEDAQNVQASDVMALVDRVQEVSVKSIEGLAQMISTSPVISGSAAAVLLVTVLMQRARMRRVEDRDFGDA